jgi:hypothetical protein
MTLSSENHIPQEMFRNGRPIDPVFRLDEKLYIRFDRIDGKNVDPACIMAPVQSVNRSKYSKAEWVLLAKFPKFINWGYGFFRVSDVPQSITSEFDITHYFKVEHVPEDDNYSHSEVRAYKNEKPVKHKNDAIRLKYRVMLSQRILILKLPEIS